MNTDWHELAACRGMDTNEFFGGDAAQRRAKRVCEPCEVRAQCLIDVLAAEDRTGRVYVGIFGGTDEHERLAIRRRRGIRGSGPGSVTLPVPKAGKPPRHGTFYAYQTHECRCRECVETAQAEFRARKLLRRSRSKVSA